MNVFGEKEETEMEGEGERLPREGGTKGSMTKIIVAIVVIIVVVAAIAGALILMGGEEVKNEAPTASFSADSTQVDIGGAVVFDASDSADTDGDIVEYQWNFGDGNWLVTSSPVAMHYYSISGSAIVQLIVKDDGGATTTSDVAYVTVVPVEASPSNDTAPVAVIQTSVDSAAYATSVNGTVTFDASRSFDWWWNASSAVFEVNSSAIENYTWTIVGGTYVNYAASFNYKFTEAGVFAMWLRVTDADGLTGDTMVSILVKTTGAGGAVPRADSFVMATIGEPESLDPAYDYESAGNEIIQNVYETLVWYDNESAADLVPQLATSVPTLANGGISADGLTYTFNLRQGVKFHDGTTMDATDVEYSIERVLTINDDWGPAWILGQCLIPGYGTGALDPDAINASVTVVNANTVRFNLVFPYAPFIYCLAYTVASVVSNEYVEAHGGVQVNTLSDWMTRHECGTGPFQLKEWVPNQYVLMERFDQYWNTPAELKYVIIKKVQDVGTREMMLFAGDADCVYIPRQHKEDVAGRDYLRIVEGKPTFTMDFIGFNHDIVASSTIDVGDIPAWFFDDVNVRQAFVHAFDYNKYLADIMLGTGIQPRGVIPQGMFGYNDSIPLQEYNLTKAADYLKLAINNRTGNSYAEDGFSTVLYYNAGNLVRESASLLFAENLESLSDLGLITGDINIDVRALDWSGAMLPAVRAHQLGVYFLGWMPDYADPDDYTYPFYHENGTYALRQSLNDHELTLMCEEAAQEVDPILRAQMYFDIETHVYENAYFAWLTQATNFHVERAWVTGYYFNPMHSGLMYYTLGK